MKECFKCGVEKDLSFFYKHKQMADGHLNKCIECSKSDITKNRNKNIDHYRSYDRARGSRQSYEYTREYRLEFPKKYKAHCLINNAIRDGRMRKEVSCSVCSSGDSVHAHHDDYNHPMTVRWLCCVCHKAWHKLNGEAPNGRG